MNENSITHLNEQRKLKTVHFLLSETVIKTVNNSHITQSILWITWLIFIQFNDLVFIYLFFKINNCRLNSKTSLCHGSIRNMRLAPSICPNTHFWF